MYGQDEVVKLLLSCTGVNPNCESKDSSTPFLLAISEFHASTALMFLKLPGIRVHGKIESSDNNTPLHLAARMNYHEIMDKVLAITDADLNVKNDSKATPLVIAIMNSSFECIDRLLQCKGIDVNAQDHIEVRH